MSDREQILCRVKEAVEALPFRTPLPEYDPVCTVKRSTAPGGSLAECFAAELAAVHGRLLDGWKGIAELLRAEKCRFGYCDPEFHAEFSANVEGVEIQTVFDRSEVDRYEFAITRAAGAIAETGTIVLNDACSPYRLAALAPWIHIAVVNPTNLWPSTVEALASLGDDPNVIWVTGPSKTADVEGILVEGVHGPGIQACVFA